MLQMIRACAFLLCMGLVLTAVALPQLSQANSTYNISIFSVPGSANTVAAGIDNHGNIIGTFDDATGLHAFIRDRLGNFVTFDAPSATLTLGFDINKAGVAVGSFIDNSGSTEQTGFIRDRAGSFTTFRVPGIDGDTIPVGINIFGQITGFTEDEETGHRASFLRNRDGSLITFSVPGTTRTEAAKINDWGVIAGEYQDATGFHGFVRTRNGTIIRFELPGDPALQSIGQLGINNCGEIVGAFADNVGKHGFLRRLGGSVTTVDVAGATKTNANDINDFGVIVGDFEDQEGSVKAFIATPTQKSSGIIPCFH